MNYIMYKKQLQNVCLQTSTNNSPNLNVAHGEVDGKDDGHTNQRDNEHKDDQMPLKLYVLQGIASTFPEEKKMIDLKSNLRN